MAVEQSNASRGDTAGPAKSGARTASSRGVYVLRTFGAFFILGGLIVLFSLTSEVFLTGDNFKGVLVLLTVAACLTLGVLFPLIVGEFDLSIGFAVGVLAMVGAYAARAGWGLVPVIILMIAGGILIGLVNGILVAYLNISSFIATLAVGTILQGITFGLSQGEVLSQNIPSGFLNLSTGYIGPLAISVWITLLLAIILFYVLEHTPFGRSLYAVGGGVRVAFLAGLRTNRLKVIAFILCGVFVAIAAMFALGQLGSASPSFGPSLLLPAYAAAFLGVTTFRPGYYNVVGSVVGILLLAIGFNGLSLWGVPFWVQPIFNGGVLILAVLTARAEARTVRIG